MSISDLPLSRKPKIRDSMWFEDKRTNKEGICPHAEWHIMCYGAGTLLSCGELPDTRGMLHSMVSRYDPDFFCTRVL
jgi:hypothetical protein